MTAETCMLALQVARTSTGVYVSSRLSGRGSEEDEEDMDPCLEVENLLCVTVDACGRSTSGFMNAHFLYSRARLGSDADEDGDVDSDLEIANEDDVETYSLEVTPSAPHLRHLVLVGNQQQLSTRPVVFFG